jgi:hypothetical protein
MESASELARASVLEGTHRPPPLLELEARRTPWLLLQTAVAVAVAARENY